MIKINRTRESYPESETDIKIKVTAEQNKITAEIEFKSKLPIEQARLVADLLMDRLTEEV